LIEIVEDKKSADNVVGMTSNQVERHYANFTYQANSWRKPRRVFAKVGAITHAQSGYPSRALDRKCVDHNPK
jgi:hypothetical protein